MGKETLERFLGCFAASGTRCLESAQATVTSDDHQGTLEQNIQLRVRKLCLGRGSWVSLRAGRRTVHVKQEPRSDQEETLERFKVALMSPDLNACGNLRALKWFNRKEGSDYQQRSGGI